MGARNTDTFTAPGLAEQIDREASATAWRMHAAIRNGFNHLDARPPFAEFKSVVLGRFERNMTDPNVL
ncbi:hypothetical protein LTA6_003412 [Microbacterium sp. LTA6]|uniref:hypothetical protein n=1 Tax=Microbacterium sp. LTA6 TaxID=3129771 RepID=UPI0032463C3B